MTTKYKRIQISVMVTLIFAALLNTNYTIPSMADKKYTMLCLGDSYTIGESVSESERFPNQCVKMLDEKGIHFDKPHIIARTGWTTDELALAIEEANVTGTFNAVTVLIGVNNQYRGYNHDIYRKEFKALLQTAIKYAGGSNDHVFVVSIPDWGATPFGARDGKGRSPGQIGREIDEYNAIAKEISLENKVHYTDINPISKQATHDSALIANDNLHPSGKMYGEWAKLLVQEMAKVYTK
jgi:lysophospholipase L1-like esterase